jgi:[NiFe] hydrogenase assembly HybE family chaperone
MTETESDPTRLIEATFARIAVERMAGLPILNPALMVAAVDFRPWREYWIGVLVTPWFMNLLARPVAEDNAPDLSRRVFDLPSGNYEFTVSREDGLGVFLSCPMISPMSQFAGQDDAMAVAHAIMQQVFQPTATTDSAATPGSTLSRRGFLSAFLPADKAM